MDIKQILIQAGALRQFLHNDRNEIVYGYDKEITDKVLTQIEFYFKDQTELASAIGRNEP